MALLTCPDCGQRVGVKKNGRLRAHATGPKGERRACDGAKLKAETVMGLEAEKARKAKAT